MAIRKLIEGVLQQGDISITNNNTDPVVVLSLDLSSTSAMPDRTASGDCAILVEFQVLGWDSTGAAGMATVGFHSFEIQSGTLTSQGSTSVVHDVRAVSLSGTNIVIDTTGSTIRLQIIGVLSITAKYMASWKVSLWQPT